MLEPNATEIRQELVAVRVGALRHAARASHPGPLRRAAGNAFVRLGLLLGSDGSVPPSALRPESLEEVSAHAGASSVLLSARRTRPRVAPIATWEDFQRELAAPYGVRVAHRSTG